MNEHPSGKSVYFQKIGGLVSQEFKDHISRLPDGFLPRIEESTCVVVEKKPTDQILCEIGDLLGIEAYTQDDGKILSQPIVEKLPELVAKLVYTNTKLKSELNALKAK